MMATTLNPLAYGGVPVEVDLRIPDYVVRADENAAGQVVRFRMSARAFRLLQEELCQDDCSCGGGIEDP